MAKEVIGKTEPESFIQAVKELRGVLEDLFNAFTDEIGIPRLLDWIQDKINA